MAESNQRDQGPKPVHIDTSSDDAQSNEEPVMATTDEPLQLCDSHFDNWLKVHDERLATMDAEVQCLIDNFNDDLSNVRLDQAPKERPIVRLQFRTKAHFRYMNWIQVADAEHGSKLRHPRELRSKNLETDLRHLKRLSSDDDYEYFLEIELWLRKVRIWYAMARSLKNPMFDFIYGPDMLPRIGYGYFRG